MAKHKIDGKGFVSKGLRRSSIKAGKTKQRVVVQAERVATAMREAMLNIKISASEPAYGNGRNIVANILTCANRNAGNNVVGRGWTANLSPRTVRALTEQGVFA